MKRGKNRIKEIISRYIRHELPPEVAQSVQAWLASDVHRQEKDEALYEVYREIASECNVDTHASLKKVWDKLQFPQTGRCTADELMRYAEATKSGRESSENRMSLRRTFLFRAAAVVIPLMVLAGVTWIRFARQDRPAGQVQLAQGFVSIRTTTGPDKIQKVVLQDGSVVWLNGNSILTETGKRKVSLDGEAYFSVVKDTAKPFALTTAYNVVTVLGTEFNVEARPDTPYTRTVLYSGKVKVTAGGQDYMLEPGEQLAYDNKTEKALVSPATEAQPHWMDQKLNANNSTLGDVLESVEWYYGVTFETDGSVNLGAPVSFRLYPNEGLESVLSSLQAISGDFSYTIRGDKVILTALKK